MNISRHRLVSRRGLTLLEVILAVVLLALVAATALSICASIIGMQIREQRTLAAAELANRLILQYLDDENTMPNPSSPLDYGADRYRWSMAKDPVAFREARPDTASTTQTASGGVRLDSTILVRIRVWLSEESGGDLSPGQGQPEVTLCRLVHPLSVVNRNPDTMQRLFSDENRRRQFMEQMTGVPSSGGGRSGGQSGQGGQGGNRGGGK